MNSIVVDDGTLEFADESNMVINAGSITMNGGVFIAGTEDSPYQHQLTFVMYGNYYGTQLPMFGNKGIGCLNCQFSMYGQPRNRTWTQLAQTINAGDNTLTVLDYVDWMPGEQIVIASTSFDHNEA